MNDVIDLVAAFALGVMALDLFIELRLRYYDRKLKKAQQRLRDAQERVRMLRGES